MKMAVIKKKKMDQATNVVLDNHDDETALGAWSTKVEDGNAEAENNYNSSYPSKMLITGENINYGGGGSNRKLFLRNNQNINPTKVTLAANSRKKKANSRLSADLKMTSAGYH